MAGEQDPEDRDTRERRVRDERRRVEPDRERTLDPDMDHVREELRRHDSELSSGDDDT
jgi:hypothetical protein